MSRFRLLIVSLAVVFSIVAVRLAWKATHRDDDRDGGTRAATQAARIAAQAALRTSDGTAVGVGAAVNVPPAAPVEVLTGVEKRFADAGLSRGESLAMKEAFPDWQTRFSSASDDMLKAHASRVQHLIPVHIPDEVSHVANIDVLSKSGAGDDALRMGGASGVLDDVARTGGSVVDDVARGGASMLDDILRVLGLGAAGAAAAGGAAMSKKKK